jgi:pyridoxamine 5'-phosphate oxidase
MPEPLEWTRRALNEVDTPAGPCKGDHQLCQTTGVAQYTRNSPLTEAELTGDPTLLFDRWLGDAVAAEVIEPTAMTLATVGEDGRPSARIVLFKGWVDGGLTFYTNYESRKGVELAAQPQAALLFWWNKLERSVRFEGPVTRVSRQQSSAYFHSRPRGSQLGALISQQSAVIASRAELEDRLVQAEARYASGEVPLPDHWGGYRLQPEVVEFWQGRRDRLHDRFRFRREATGWGVERLQP